MDADDIIKQKKKKQRSIYDTQQTDYSGVYLQNEKLEQKLRRLLEELYKERKITTLQRDTEIFEITKEIENFRVMIESSDKLKIFQRPFTTPNTFRIPVPTVSDVKRDPKTFPSSWFSSAYVPSDTELNRIKRFRHQRSTLSTKESKGKGESRHDEKREDSVDPQRTWIKLAKLDKTRKLKSWSYSKSEQRHPAPFESPRVFSSGFSKAFSDDSYKNSLLRLPEAYTSDYGSSNTLNDVSSIYSSSSSECSREMYPTRKHANGHSRDVVMKTDYQYSYELPRIQPIKPHEFSLMVRPPTNESKRPGETRHGQSDRDYFGAVPLLSRRTVSMDTATRSLYNDLRRGNTDTALQTLAAGESSKHLLKPPDWKTALEDFQSKSDCSDHSTDVEDDEPTQKTCTRSLRQLKEMASLDNVANKAIEMKENRKKRLIEHNKRKLERIEQKIRKFVQDIKEQMVKEKQIKRDKERQRLRRRKDIPIF